MTTILRPRRRRSKPSKNVGAISQFNYVPFETIPGFSGTTELVGLVQRNVIYAEENMTTPVATEVQTIRTLAGANLTTAFDKWTNHVFLEDIDREKVLSRPVNLLTVETVLALSFEKLDGHAHGIVHRMHQQNFDALDRICGESWIEMPERRPLLISAYLSLCWIPSLCQQGLDIDALNLATRFLLRLRARRFRNVLGAGNNGRHAPSDSRNSIRLMLMATVFNSLAMHLTGQGQNVQLATRYLMETFFSEEDLSPCAAIWAPAVGYVVDILVPRAWRICDASARPELLAAYDAISAVRNHTSPLVSDFRTE